MDRYRNTGGERGFLETQGGGTPMRFFHVSEKPKLKYPLSDLNTQKEIIVQQAPGVVVNPERTNRIDTMPQDIEDFGLRSLVTGFLR